jgi:pimeloyl-ACP methyl ester carboxylesterase
VLVHGIASSYRTFDNLIPLLGDYRVIAVDLLGFGSSSAPDSATFTLNEHVQYLERALEKLHLHRRFVLVGHSLGALIVSRYAAKHAWKLSGVVLVSPPIYLAPDSVSDPRERAAMETYAKVYDFLRTRKEFTLRHAARLARVWPIEQGFEVTEETWRAFALSLERSIQSQTTIADVAATRVPVHVVYGSLDPVIVPPALNIIEQMRHVTSHRVERGDHALRPRAAQVVAETIAELSAPPTSSRPAASG